MALDHALVENNLHRDALHHLDVISGGIFWWQDAETRSTRARDRIDAVKIEELQGGAAAMTTLAYLLAEKGL